MELRPVSAEIDRLEEQLNERKVSVREEALQQLGALGSPRAIQAVGTVLAGDENDNLRRRAAEVLGETGSPEAVAPLAAALLDEPAAFVRRAAARALGALGDAAVPHLARSLREDPDQQVGFASATALTKLTAELVVSVLLEALEERSEPALQGYLVKQVGELGTEADGRALEPCLEAGRPQEVRRAALSATVTLRGVAVLPTIAALLREDADAAVRRRAAECLGEIDDPDVLRPLFDALLCDDDAAVQEAAFASLRRVGDVQSKVDIALNVLTQKGLLRGDVDAPAVFGAFRNGEAPDSKQDRLILDHLISRAVGAERGLTGLIASLVLAGCGDNVSAGGRYINEYEAAGGLASGALRQLRIEIGGETALDPILRILERDLQIYFQQPIHELNEQTKRSWQKTIQAAHWGFLARMIMSGIVFLVGMVLLTVSAWRFLAGELDGAALWGVGVSFATGLGTMLLVVYTGPLKDIRQAVSDLGASSAAFIAYVHRVLQTSHTFSVYYLRQRISFEEMAKSSSLIREAMHDTIRSLQYDLETDALPPPADLTPSATRTSRGAASRGDQRKHTS